MRQSDEIIIIFSCVLLLIILVMVWQPWKIITPPKQAPSSKQAPSPEQPQIKVIKKIVPRPEPEQPAKKPAETIPEKQVAVEHKKPKHPDSKKETPDKKPIPTTKPEKPEKEPYPRQDERDFMVNTQLIPRDIKDKKVIEAFKKVPRHLFVPKDIRRLAYEDSPLPIGYGQTISQPYIVALMTELLELDGSEKVLEIGTGSGYQAAILAEIVKDVYTIEIIPELAERASKVLEECGYKNVQTGVGDGYFGWKKHQPFDAIIVTAAASHVPPPLLEQLKDGGILVIPLGNPMLTQTLTIFKKEGEEITINYSIPCRFVPMTGHIQKKGR